MLHSELLGDAEIESLISDQSYMETAVKVECALLHAQADCGELDKELAEQISNTLLEESFKASELLKEAAEDGVFIPALLKKFRASLDKDEAVHLHRGATSQDIIDTSTVLILRGVIQNVLQRIIALGNKLKDLANEHTDTLMLSRTRMQAAGVTNFSYKAASWLAPFTRHIHRLREIESRLYLISLGGSSGTQAAFVRNAEDVEQNIASTLGLKVPTTPWHTQRDNIIELGNWLCLVTNSIAKIAGDMILMMQTEIAELRDNGGGASSAMPHKSNPVRLEAIITLAAKSNTEQAALQQAAQHTHERGGAAWYIEWLSLPQLLVASGASLRLLNGTLDDLEIKRDAMRVNLDKTQGLVLAEAAVKLLAETMPLSDARLIVNTACKNLSSGTHLFDELAKQSSKDIDWATAREPQRHIGRAVEHTEKIIKEWDSLKL